MIRIFDPISDFSKETHPFLFLVSAVVYFQYSLHDVSSRTKVDGIDY